MAARKSAELGILTLLTAALAGGVGFVMYERKINKKRVKIALEDGNERAENLSGWLSVPQNVKALLPEVSFNPADILLGNTSKAKKSRAETLPPQSGPTAGTSKTSNVSPDDQ